MRWLHVLVALVCFGPIGLVLFLGVLLVPLWTAMLIGYLSAEVVPYDPDGHAPWGLISDILMVLSGVIGLAGLSRVLTMVVNPKHPVKRRRLTNSMVAIGLIGVIWFNVVDGWINPAEALGAALVYWVLPAFGSAYFLYVARNQLFVFRPD